jgi:HlyD family secretion protein
MRKLYLPSCLLMSAFLVGCSQNEQDDKAVNIQNDRIISAPGELVSLQEIYITPPVISRMRQFSISYLARENAMVKEGDVLIKFDGQSLKTELVTRKSDLDARVKEAEQKKLQDEATFEQLVLDLAEAKKDKDIAKRKVEITDVSRSQIERKKQQAEFGITNELHGQATQRMSQHKIAMAVNEQVQGARISIAQSRVDEINDSIIKLVVIAPKSGMVVLVPNGDNNKPTVGDSVFLGSRLISLPSLDNIAVKVEFDESFSANIGVGGEVKVILDAFPEKPFTGKISEIGKAYRSKSRNNLKVVFDVWVTLEELDMAIMRPGMKASVAVVEEAS